MTLRSSKCVGIFSINHQSFNKLFSQKVTEEDIECAIDENIVDCKTFDDEQFIVINSDIWTDYNLKVLRDLNLEDNLAHIVLTNTPDYLDGDFSCDGKNLLVGNSYVFSGIGKYHRELFVKHSDVELGDILRSEKKITFSVYDGKWMDIGTPERLEKARRLEQGPT